MGWGIKRLGLLSVWVSFRCPSGVLQVSVNRFLRCYIWGSRTMFRTVFNFTPVGQLVLLEAPAVPEEIHLMRDIFLSSVLYAGPDPLLSATPQQMRAV